MRENVLIELGFSKNEEKVYLALLRLGSATAGIIASKIDVHRTNIYDALDRLIEKGLVTYIFKGKKKLFQSTSPERILDLLKDQQKKFEAVLPTLLLDQKLSKEREKAVIYEGMKGIRAITDDILQEGKDVLTFGVPRDMSEKMKNFVSIYHKRRIKNKMWQWHIYDADAKERITYLNTLPFTKAAYLPNEYESPATTTVYGDKVAMFIWSEPELGIVIQSKRIADQYRKYFNLLWGMAKK